MELTAEEARMLGCLVEKQRATPDQYPLTTNSLRTACNQKTSREPVVDYSEIVVDQTMKGLRERGLARTTQAAGSRTSKHRHVLDEALRLDDQQISVLALLFLRGAQTPNELLARTSRLCSFADGADVERTLDHLANRDDPLVRCIGRAPGQRDDRWIQVLTPDAGGDDVSGTAPATERIVETAQVVAPPTDLVPDAAPPEQACPGPVAVVERGMPREEPPESGSLADRVLELEDEVQSLRSDLDLLRNEFDALARQLGA